MTSIPPRRPLVAWSAIAAGALLLCACGGGGEGPADAQAAAGAEDATAAALAVLPTGLPMAPAGLSGNVVCGNQRIGAISVDNVEVASGAACQLDGTIVRGSVQAKRASIIDIHRAQVAGSVQSQDGAYLTVRGGTRVGGNVEAQSGGGVDVRGSEVAGNLIVHGLHGAVLLSNNTVRGGVQVTDSLGGGNITGNRITGNLQCTGNVPRPLASGNTAAAIEGDCAPGAGGGGGGGGTPLLPPLSGNATCAGLIIGAVALDSVIVPANATCSLVGTRLIGSIEVGANARLVADGVRVNGNLIADGARSLMLGGLSTIGGSVQVKQGAAASIVGAAITGDLQIDNMSGAVHASANRITGNLQAMANRGGLTMNHNRMGGVMQCKDNLPAPVGGGNVATLKQDQCQGL